MCTSAYPFGDKRLIFLLLTDCPVGRVVASATAEQGVSGSIPDLGKELLGFFGFSKISQYGVWNCAQYMAIDSPLITWDL
ncbi:hypothetical protein SFRURICE_016066 [Spodoptera frugiperda]|nr:hypothetical protein SFRURICE_016066 [Spodoptera frugiperda]